MNLLISPYTDPYLNLATEEYLLKNSMDDFVLLYVNRPCVVVGKHQITQKEINSNFVYSHNISVARRLSGGGTVYHDEGNLNFSYIQSIPSGGSISYGQITASIFGFLKHKIPSIELSERNDFVLQGKKVSGSAMHVYKDRLIAHGTLLVDCNLANLSAALKVNQLRFTDKSIASRKAAVMNVSEACISLSINTLVAEFTQYLTDFWAVKNFQLSGSEIDQIHQLALSRYSDHNWIFCYSPKYTYTNRILFGNNTLLYRLEVVKGIIESVFIEPSDDINNDIILTINRLKGLQHNIFALCKEIIPANNSSFQKVLLDSLF